MLLENRFLHLSLLVRSSYLAATPAGRSVVRITIHSIVRGACVRPQLLAPTRPQPLCSNKRGASIIPDGAEGSNNARSPISLSATTLTSHTPRRRLVVETWEASTVGSHTCTPDTLAALLGRRLFSRPSFRPLQPSGCTTPRPWPAYHCSESGRVTPDSTTIRPALLNWGSGWSSTRLVRRCFPPLRRAPFLTRHNAISSFPRRLTLSPAASALLWSGLRTRKNTTKASPAFACLREPARHCRDPARPEPSGLTDVRVCSSAACMYPCTVRSTSVHTYMHP